ncbi:MAG: hypothetical protein ACPGQM_14495 [Alphaproteobacteria bacterium]
MRTPGRDIFARGDNVLRNAGRLAWSETRRVSFEHRLPGCCWRSKADAIERAALLCGLDALALAYGRGDKNSDAARATKLP